MGDEYCIPDMVTSHLKGTILWLCRTSSLYAPIFTATSYIPMYVNVDLYVLRGKAHTFDRGIMPFPPVLTMSCQVFKAEDP